MIETRALKILTADQWQLFQSEGVFQGAPIDLADGYIHLSTAAQVAETAAKHFAGQTGPILATIDLALLGDAIVWEPSRGGQLFPHCYGPLPMRAVIEAVAMDGAE